MRKAGGMMPPIASRVRRAFAAAAMMLVALYVLIDVVLQLLPPHYSVVSDAESDLAVGPFGGAMRFNFAARAVMSGCLVVAVALTAPPTRRRLVGSALLALAGLCSAVLVLLPTDVNRVGEFGMTPRTTIGLAHVVFATAGFVAVLFAMGALTWWAGGATGQGVFVLAVFFLVALAGLALLGLSLAVLPSVVGLAERICLGGILGWAFTLGARLRRPATALG
jgi:hypothetical protein